MPHPGRSRCDLSNLVVSRQDLPRHIVSCPVGHVASYLIASEQNSFCHVRSYPIQTDLVMLVSSRLFLALHIRSCHGSTDLDFSNRVGRVVSGLGVSSRVVSRHVGLVPSRFIKTHQIGSGPDGSGPGRSHLDTLVATGRNRSWRVRTRLIQSHQVSSRSRLGSSSPGKSGRVRLVHWVWLIPVSWPAFANPAN